MLFAVTVKAQQVKFIPNNGQWNPEVLYKADIPGGDLYVTRKGLVYNLFDKEAVHEYQHHAEQSKINAHAVFLTFKNTAGDAKSKQYGLHQTNYNFYQGNDKKYWKTGVKASEKVVLENIYPNIDFEIDGVDGGIKTSFIVKKYGDPNIIRWEYSGAERISLTDNVLKVKHSLGEITELQPFSFITNGQILYDCPTKYLLSDSSVSYHISNLKSVSHNDSLVIDPAVVFSTFSGSVADNFGFTATFDQNGNGYSAGVVYSIGFPVTAGAYQVDFKGGVRDVDYARDVGILKYSSDGKQLLYATYLGGTKNEQPHSMICDKTGNLFVMGTTSSTDFPVLNGFDMSHNGEYDVFVTSFSPDGTQINASTYVGGNANDGINGIEHRYSNSAPTVYNYGDYYRGDIKLDDDGNPYIATTTYSNSTSGGLPLMRAVQQTFGGGYDAWVFKLSKNLNQLLFSTYLGGGGSDAAYSIRITPNGFYVAGGTTSANMPVSQGNINELRYKGNVDGFISWFAETGLIYQLRKTVYLGHNSYDQIHFVTTDNNGQVYVTGQTESVLPRYGNVKYEDNGKHFISILSADLTQINAQTVFGKGDGVKISPAAFMVDQCNRIYFSGWGGETNNKFNKKLHYLSNLTITPDAIQKTTDGSDFYMIVFNKNLFSVAYATYYGGSVSEEHVDGGTSHFDESGVIYQSVCAGCGGFSDFPTTTDAYSRINKGRTVTFPIRGGCNNALFKMDIKPTLKDPFMRDTLLTVVLTDTLNYSFTINDDAGDSIVIDNIDGNIFSGANNPELIKTENQPGLTRFNLRWITNCSTPVDTFILTIRFFKIGCETSSLITGTIKVVVQNMPKAVVDLNCLKLSGTNSATLTWLPFQSRYSNYFTVFQSKNGASFDSLTSFSMPTSLSSHTFSVNNPALNNYCYRIALSNRCHVYGAYSRETCLNTKDSIDTTAYSFSRDTLFFVRAADSLNVVLNISDIEFNDSLFVNYYGELVNDSSSMISHTERQGFASIHINYKAPCNRIGDTVTLHFSVRNNRCPQPLRNDGIVKVIIGPPHPAPSNALLCLKKTGPTSVAIRWDNAFNNTHTWKYSLLKKTHEGQFIQSALFGPVCLDNISEIVNDPHNSENCFALISYDYCENISDTGAFSCTPWHDSLYPPQIVPYYVTVINNRDIELSWTPMKNCNVQLWGGDAKSTDRRLLYHTTVYEDTLWRDDKRGIDVHKASYCYMIEPENDCGLRPKKLAKACSILLEGKTEPFEHTVWWSEYDYFRNETEYYSVQSANLSEPGFTERVKSGSKHLGFIDDKLNRETGIFNYRIVAAENNSIYSSMSNTIELRQKPLLHVPNAYTQNNDGLNDNWNIIPAFVKDYNLKLYDRWGRLVYETSDKHEKVELADKYGNPLLCDVYIYVITYTGFTNEAFTLRGNLTILK